ncbi:Lipopolysaccharide biosynthesis protein, LPS:glycosyltransferase [Carnobacterium iners]|uniref:Lipopolysaccharide biosynthesis protein, LPS:glycosyltransferase n=1 Tax=Carnobacterium iners TaxID=1073423 RepID=A0A1X7N7J8_9LACT|nr:glycosyltransferase family 8 protein [Carnobacterium iners]SEL27434.1 Lipopolysaccharide biosynthesis protein, LPS:glycosyltransferase [Carnobacterium iners]SMH33470.1 Lipopolysaccharide biosynthesis protein, LPS:glycosyltransferase [Carnobacterium iners]
MFDETEVTIISAANEEFVPHLATLFLSLLQTKKRDTILNFYVIDDHIALVSKEKLNRMINEYDATISYLQIDTVEFDDMVESDRIPTTAYFRIAIPNFLKSTDIKRAIYLDCDIIALQPIEDIWAVDLGDKLLAAVEDAGFHQRLDAMEIDAKSNTYFNSGVMIIDIDKWRAEKISEQVLAFASKNQEELKFHDQDALNAILHDRWLILHPKWNAQAYILLDEKEHPTKIGKMEYDEARSDPALVHYSGHVKPWCKESTHPYRENYLTLREQTPFPIE